MKNWSFSMLLATILQYMEKLNGKVISGLCFPLLLVQYKNKWKKVGSITVNMMESFHLLPMLAPQNNPYLSNNNFPKTLDPKMVTSYIEKHENNFEKNTERILGNPYRR
jgi:hypothetical protein